MHTPPEVNVESLGPLEKEYTISGSTRWLGYGIIGFLAVVGTAVAVNTSVAWKTYDPEGRAICLGLAGLALAGIVPAVIYLVRVRREHVSLHAGGLTHRRGERRLETFPWADIESVFVVITKVHTEIGVPLGKSRRYTLQRRDGRQLVLTETLGGVDELLARVQAKTGCQLLPAALARVAAGESVAFGKSLAVNERGLVRGGGRTLEWTRLEGVKVAEGVVSIRARDSWLPWTMFSYGHLPNATVFLQLVEHLRVNALRELDPIRGALAAAGAERTPTRFGLSRVSVTTLSLIVGALLAVARAGAEAKGGNVGAAVIGALVLVLVSALLAPLPVSWLAWRLSGRRPAVGTGVFCAVLLMVGLFDYAVVQDVARDVGAASPRPARGARHAEASAAR